jgi:hypothetical protein
MKVSSVLVTLAVALFVSAESVLDHRSLHARHSKLAQRSPKLSKRKSCKPRSPEPKPKPTTTHKSTSTHKAAATPDTKPINNSGSGSAKGLINVKSTCGAIGATTKTTKTSGPNGSIDWLNCGLTGGGWSPPYVQVKDLITVDLQSAVNSGNGPFGACKAYIHLFEKYGGQYGIPPIMLASFAMQESSCNPNTIGGAGEQGLMQITKDKCGGAPGGNCREPDFNIRTGAKYFSTTLNGNGGNVILAVAQYNGWRKGLTYKQATAAAHTGCCRCQNNCDYLHQFFNGWLQNINAYDSSFRLGKYFNLDVCN